MTLHTLKGEKKKKVTFYITEDTADTLQYIAGFENQVMSHIVEQALKDYAEIRTSAECKKVIAYTKKMLKEQK